MKIYEFDPTEFAKLEFLLGRAVSFFHQERSKIELDQFQAAFWPVLKDVYYNVLGNKIDDRQREAISESDPDPWDRDVPSRHAIETLARIFEA